MEGFVAAQVQQGFYSAVRLGQSNPQAVRQGDVVGDPPNGRGLCRVFQAHPDPITVSPEAKIDKPGFDGRERGRDFGGKDVVDVQVSLGRCQNAGEGAEVNDRVLRAVQHGRWTPGFSQRLRG